jgi:hypothetical protein
MHFYGWEKGLKTGQYYLRSRPARDAIKFTVNMEALMKAADSKDESALLDALEKVENKNSPSKPLNLGRKTTSPIGGFGREGEIGSGKKQKLEEEEEYDPFTCTNCGS